MVVETMKSVIDPAIDVIIDSVMEPTGSMTQDIDRSQFKHYVSLRW